MISSPAVSAPEPHPQLCCGHLPPESLAGLLARYGLNLTWVDVDQPIPGSYWGPPEAGILGHTLYVRPDTPVHSALHETCHVICMDTHRRQHLDTDAGGDDLEECGVCYLQILLADHLPGATSARLCQDMDAWGYSFRLGSTQAWFHQDATDARAWLQAEGLLTGNGEPVWRLR